MMMAPHPHGLPHFLARPHALKMHGVSRDSAPCKTVQSYASYTDGTDTGGACEHDCSAAEFSVAKTIFQPQIFDHELQDMTFTGAA